MNKIIHDVIKLMNRKHDSVIAQIVNSVTATELNMTLYKMNSTGRCSYLFLYSLTAYVRVPCMYSEVTPAGLVQD